MKTYDEVTEHILSAARIRHRKKRQIQYAASVSAVCAACIMGLGVYMQLEKPPTAPIQKETFTSTVSESVSASSGEFPETFTLEQPAPPEESGSMTDLTEPSAYASETPGTGSSQYAPTVFPSASETLPSGSSAAESQEPHTDPTEKPDSHYTDIAETLVSQETGVPTDSPPPWSEAPTEAPPPRTEFPTESPIEPTQGPLAWTDGPTECPVDPTESPVFTQSFEETDNTTSYPATTDDFSDLLAQLPTFHFSGKIDLTANQIVLLIRLYNWGVLPDYWAEYVETFILTW